MVSSPTKQAQGLSGLFAWTTLDSPISVDHSNSLEPILISSPCENSIKKSRMADIIFFSRKLMCMTILFYIIFSFEVIHKALTWSLHEDLRESKACMQAFAS